MTVKMLIIIVLFITLANRKQLNYYKLLRLKIVGIYKKYIALICSLLKAVFFYFFVLIYVKWLIVNIVETSVSLEISIGTVIRNLEMLKFVPDHLKTKNMCKHAAKNYLW